MADHGASSSSSFKYDVFLSFRGDTRHTFTDHLYDALTKKNIITFRDDHNLRVGNVIAPTLLEAIEKSRMAIVVLCQNYASSTWCLDELVKIMECKDKERSIFPIFYHVEPSDVRHQKNKYEAAMSKHENRYGRDSPKVAAWRSALAAVSNISGKPCTQSTSESGLIGNIVEEVWNKLSLNTLYIKHSGGFDSRLEKVKLRLDIGKRSILMLGIYGDGEISKTRFALELYNKIQSQFEAASFLANVSAKSKAGTTGIENLQMTLLSEMGEEIKTKIGSTFRGSSEIQRRLSHKRVLLVLDDIDSIQQLVSLAGGSDWFVLGSRIIVTTRDADMLNKHVLDNVEIEIYCLDESEAEANKRKKDIGEEHVVGLVNSFNIILTHLKGEDSSTNIVSIIGMGGLGKTTLANKIYFNNEITKLFPCRAWALVSHDYRISQVLLSLLHDLMPSPLEYKTPSEEEVKDKLREYLKKKKYLIILDDIWEPEVWDEVGDVFPDNNNGSGILITSRNKEVANYTNSSYIHDLPLLDGNESWELFCKKVFRGKKCPDDLEDIGRSIVERCQGLPIAIITLGGLLARKRSRRQWSQIKDLVPWHIAQDKENVMKVLELSYKNLPQRLKHCFLYFGMFPEDYEISAKQLIRLWIAEDFIQLEETGASIAPEPEDVADVYLDELVDHSLVQLTRRRSDGGVKECKIHDLLRQLCISLSKAEIFLEIWTKSNIRPIVSNPQRLSLLSNTESYLSAIKSNESCTHSLFIFDEKEHTNNTLENFPSVRVLNFGNRASLNSTASCLGTMTSLRYLSIEDRFNRTYDVPNCIWSLLNLETLCLKGLVSDSHMNTIPDGIWKLEKLRHVRLSWPARLPLKQGKAASSKPIWNLQTISVVAFDQSMSILISSGIFPNLKKLGLRYDAEQENCNSLREQLRSLHHLTNLRTLEIDFLRSDVSLDGIVFPSSLTKISFLDFADLTFGSINTLGQLPNLQCLKLSMGRIPRSLICSAGEFPQLQVLRMHWVKVQSWILENGAMPRLQSLVVKTCSKLNELPEQLWSLTTLRQVHLTDPSDALRKSILSYLEFNKDCKITIDNSLFGRIRQLAW